jgi:catechol 2,3-dioxygenase-like lactoylglutathione lyase family enzyme
MTALVINGLGLHIKVQDIMKSREFYEGLLGLKPTFAYGDKVFLSSIPEGVATVSERYRGVTYEPTANTPLEIADGHCGVKHQNVFGEQIESEKVSAMLRVESLLPLVEEKGVRPTFPVRHYYWNTIEMALRDPDGFVVVIVSPYSEAESERLKKLIEVEDVSPGT